jgi:hypothetical protein
VDPVIAASLIGAGATLVSVGATATVALIAYRTTRVTNTETMQAGIENTIRVVNGARDDRVWDKRADTYVDALRFLHRTQTELEDMAHTGRFVNEAERQLEDWLAGIQTSEWREIQARLLAYASQPVLDAALASERAIGRFREAFQNWKWIRANVGLDPEGPTAADALSAEQRIRPAMEEASRRDVALLEAIRFELHSRPSHETALTPGNTKAMTPPPELRP